MKHVFLNISQKSLWQLGVLLATVACGRSSVSHVRMGGASCVTATCDRVLFSAEEVKGGSGAKTKEASSSTDDDDDNDGPSVSVHPDRFGRSGPDRMNEEISLGSALDTLKEILDQERREFDKPNAWESRVIVVPDTVIAGSKNAEFLSPEETQKLEGFVGGMKADAKLKVGEDRIVYSDGNFAIVFNRSMEVQSKSFEGRDLNGGIFPKGGYPGPSSGRGNSPGKSSSPPPAQPPSTAGGNQPSGAPNSPAPQPGDSSAAGNAPQPGSNADGNHPVPQDTPGVERGRDLAVRGGLALAMQRGKVSAMAEHFKKQHSDPSRGDNHAPPGHQAKAVADGAAARHNAKVQSQIIPKLITPLNPMVPTGKPIAAPQNPFVPSQCTPAKCERLEYSTKYRRAAQQLVNADKSEYRPRRQELLDASQIAHDEAAEAYKGNDEETGDVAVELAIALTDAALSFIPGVSWVKDMAEAVTGKNVVDGHELSDFERGAAIVGAVTVGVGSKVLTVAKVGKVAMVGGAAVKKAVEVFGKVLGKLKGGRGAEKVGHAVGEAAKTLHDLDVVPDIGKTMGQLRELGRGMRNFGIGKATKSESEALGRAWIGPGGRVSSDGKAVISGDGLRQYRAPSYKGRLGKSQANFESRFAPNGTWRNNGHLDITD